MASRTRVLSFPGDDDAYNQHLEQFALMVQASHPSVFAEVQEKCSRLFSVPSYRVESSCRRDQPDRYVNDLPVHDDRSTQQTLQNPIFCFYSPSAAQVTPKAHRITCASDRCKRLLMKIPKTEKQWQTARQHLGIENERQVLSYLSKIQRCAWKFEQDELHDYSISALGKQAVAFTQELSGLSGFTGFISFLFITACCLDKNTGTDELEVISALEAFLKAQKGIKLKNNSRFPRKVMTGALKVVALIDRLYDKLEHRAFELLIHLSISPTDLCHLTQDDITHIESAVDTWKPTEEIQAGAPLYIVYLLQLWRPTQTLAEIGKSLGTHLFNETESNILSQALERYTLVPSLLARRGLVRSKREGILDLSLKRKRNETDNQTRHDTSNGPHHFAQELEQEVLHGSGSRFFDSSPTTSMLESLSSGCSPSCFSSSNTSEITNLTLVSGHQDYVESSLQFGTSGKNGSCRGERPPSSGRGPMLCSDAGVEEEARSLAACGLTEYVYIDTETLPSVNVGLDEVDEDWFHALGSRNISPNGQLEHSLF